MGNRSDRNSLDSISSASSASISKSPRRHRRVIGTIDLRSRSRSGSISPSRHEDTNKSKKTQMLPTPKELAAQSDHIARERYKWEKYRCMVELAMPELNKALEDHEKSPEKHPLYPTEWKKFWNRRYKELQAEKKDPNKHDFKPEWIIFWTRRLKELHNENVEKKKAEIRKKLNLPADGVERTDELKEQYTLKCKRSPVRTEETSRSPSHHGYHGYDYYRHGVPREPLDEWGRPIYPYSAPRPASYYAYKAPPPETHHCEEVEDEPLTVVSVLRLLTALEEKLGSLGPKVIDLLAKALALEKVKANSADDILINEDNCVIFETIKEKLKGQLIAGVIEPNKINAVKRAVKNVAAIIHLVSKKSKETPPEETAKTAVEPIITTNTTATAAVAAVDATDKATIAKNIAAALIKQGKTDITTEQLEELINVYTQMAQKAKESNEPVTTAQFLQDSGNSPEEDDTNQSSTASTTSKVIDNTVVPSPENQNDEPLPSQEDEEDDSPNVLESLTDSDLQTLLQNFKDLSTEEQQHLIAYLKKLESSEPLRVEKLRKFVNVDVTKPDDEVVTAKNDKVNFASSRAAKPVLKPTDNIFFDDEDDPPPQPKRIVDSDDEDDYSFDDVFRAASNNVKEKSNSRSGNDEQNEDSESSSNESTSTQKLSLSIADTQNLIANLMGSFQKNVKDMASTSAKVNAAPVQVQNETQTKSVPFYQQQSTYYDEPMNGMQSTSAATSLYDTNQGSYNNMPYFQQGYGQMPQNTQNQAYPIQYPNIGNPHQNQQNYCNPMMQHNSMDNQPPLWNNNQRPNNSMQRNQQRFKKR
ncbi:hypothetical protein Bhyg_16134, partial [Pseudolycoriella hygida]